MTEDNDYINNKVQCLNDCALVTWKDADGSLLSQIGCPVGEMPVFKGDTPQKAADNENHYRFTGWNDGTNTYAPVDYLRKIYYEALSDPRISGIAIATRPDCLPGEVLDLLDEINRNHFLWVELGLQSIHPETQNAMNLCYTTEDYDKAAAELSKRGIKYVTHIILGLPGENEDMIFDSLKHVCNIDPHPFGLKLHLMNIVKSSALYKTMPDYVSFNSIDEYVDLVIRCLEIIPDDITIHRLTGDVPRKILVSPEWSYRKRTILNSINKELSLRDTRQGSKSMKKAADAAVNK